MEVIRGPLDEHRQNPALQAEIAFFDALTAADIPGSIIYNLNIGRQVDGFAWTLGGRRIAYEAKGGLHWIEDGRWYCQDRGGNVKHEPYTPVEQALRVALAASDALEERLNGHKPWINPVLVLVDVSEPNPAIAQCARDHHVQMIWGLANLADQHAQLARERPEYYPPSELDITAEAAAFDRRHPPEEWVPPAHAQRGAVAQDKRAPAAQVAVPADPANPPHGCSIVIHNQGTVIIQSSPDDALVIRPPVEPDPDRPSEPATSRVADDDMGPTIW